MAVGLPWNRPSCVLHVAWAYWEMRLSGSTARADPGTSQTKAKSSDNLRSMLGVLRLPHSRLARPLEIFGHHPVVFFRRRSRLNLQQTAANGNRHGVRSVVRSELVNQVLDVEVDGCFGNPQFARNLLVPVAIA